MQQHQRFLEVRACPGVAQPGAVWCPRWSWQPQVPQWHWAQGQECGTGAIGIVLQQHQSLVGKGAVEVSVCQLLYSLVLRQQWGAPGAEVAHGGAAAGTLLLLLPQGRQGWHGQQNPSHSPSVSQSLLWTVAAPQLGSPLVWKSSLSLASSMAHPSSHCSAKAGVALRFCPGKRHLPKLHSSPAEGLLQSPLCKAGKGTFILWMSAAASTLKMSFCAW